MRHVLLGDTTGVPLAQPTPNLQGCLRTYLPSSCSVEGVSLPESSPLLCVLSQSQPTPPSRCISRAKDFVPVASSSVVLTHLHGEILCLILHLFTQYTQLLLFPVTPAFVRRCTCCNELTYSGTSLRFCPKILLLFLLWHFQSRD